jgi:hypothetical protein
MEEFAVLMSPGQSDIVALMGPLGWKEEIGSRGEHKAKRHVVSDHLDI